MFRYVVDFICLNNNLETVQDRRQACIIISPMAIAYNVGQIIKLVCVCVSACLCIRLCALSRYHFLVDFHQNWHRCKNYRLNNEFVGYQHRTAFLHFALKSSILGQEVLIIYTNIHNPISALNVRESRNFSRP